MSPRRYVSVAEGGDAVPARNPFSMPVGVLRVFEGQTRMLVPAQMIVLSMLLRNPMGVRGAVVQLSGPLMVLVVRSVVISSGHDQMLTIWPDLVCASLASL
jgi:hypothetical protein